MYAPKYLELFLESPVKDLSREQCDALSELGRTVSDITSRNRELFKVIGSCSESIPLEKQDADMLAFRIVYPFWNRFNSGSERNEYEFARSGEHGRLLRLLKGKDTEHSNP